MANQERIDEFISEAGFAQIDKLVKALTGANEHIVQCILSAEKLNTSLAKSGAFKDLEGAMKKIEIANERLKKITAEAVLIEEKIAATRKKAAADFERDVQKNIALQEKQAARAKKAEQSERLTQIKLDQDRKKSFDSYSNQVNKQNELDEKRARLIERNSRPYTVLSNELEKQRKRAQDLAIVFGENSKQFLEAAKSVNTLDTRLKAVDATLGKSQRNVGNYKSGFNGLSHSFNQMTRELPAFTFSVQTGFLALSNNIPTFFDQLQQTKAEITRLRAEGQKVPGLFKQIASSIFSFATVLSVMVTLFSIYGKEIGEFFGAIFKGTEAIDKFTESQKKLGEAMASADVTNAVKSVAELKINIDLAKQGLLDKEKVLKQYNESIGKTTGEVKNLDEAEKQLNKNADAYIKMTLLKAAAQLALEEAAKTAFEAEKARAKGEKGITRDGEGAQQNLTFGDRLSAAFGQNDAETQKLVKSGTERTVKAANERTKTFTEIAAKFQKDAAILSKSFGFDFFGGEQDPKKAKKQAVDTSDFDAQRERVERTKNTAKEITDNENETLDIRLQALQVYINSAEELTRVNYDREVKKAKGNKDQIIFLQQALETDRENVLIEGRKIERKINEDAENELKRLFKAGLKDYEEAERAKIEAMQVSIKQQEELNAQYADSALVGLAEQYSKGIINEQEYAKAKLEVQRQYVLDSINEEIKGVQAIIDAKKAAGLDTVADEKALSELRKKLSKETAAQEITDFELIGKAAQKLKETKEQLATEVGELATSIVNGTFENQKNKIQEEIDLADEKAKHDIDNVNLSILSEEDKANKIAVIEATTAANKEVLEQKQRQVAQRQARFQKAASIASIISSTAQAIMKTYAEFGFPIGVPLAIAQGAIGAVQVATVLATPIPQYRYGKKKGDNYSGPAIVGDGYEHELRIEKNGEMSLTPNTPTLTTVSAGTQIIGGADFRRLMSKPPTLETARYNNGYDLTALIAAQENNNKKLIKAFSKQKPAKGPNINFYGLGDYMTRNFN